MFEDKNSNSKQGVIHHHEQDDVLTLEHVFCLPDLHYVDVNLYRRLSEVSARWSLLHELTLSKLEEFRPQKQETQK